MESMLGIYDIDNELSNKFNQWIDKDPKSLTQLELQAKNELGETILHYAIKKRKLDFALKIIKRRINIDCLDKDYVKPLERLFDVWDEICRIDEPILQKQEAIAFVNFYRELIQWSAIRWQDVCKDKLKYGIEKDLYDIAYDQLVLREGESFTTFWTGPFVDFWFNIFAAIRLAKVDTRSDTKQDYKYLIEAIQMTANNQADDMLVIAFIEAIIEAKDHGFIKDKGFEKSVQNVILKAHNENDKRGNKSTWMRRRSEVIAKRARRVELENDKKIEEMEALNRKIKREAQLVRRENELLLQMILQENPDLYDRIPSELKKTSQATIPTINNKRGL